MCMFFTFSHRKYKDPDDTRAFVLVLQKKLFYNSIGYFIIQVLTTDGSFRVFLGVFIHANIIEKSTSPSVPDPVVSPTEAEFVKLFFGNDLAKPATQ